MLPVNHKQQRKCKRTELPGAHPSDTDGAAGTAHGPSEGKASRRGFQLFWRQVYQASPPKYYDHKDISHKISFKFISVVPPSTYHLEKIKKKNNKETKSLDKMTSASSSHLFLMYFMIKGRDKGFLGHS